MVLPLSGERTAGASVDKCGRCVLVQPWLFVCRQMQPQRGVCGTPASILPVAEGRAEGILVYRERHKDAEIK